MEANLGSLNLWGNRGATEGKEKRGGSEGRPACGLYRGAGGGGYVVHLRREISSLLERLDERSLDRQLEDTIAALR